jgi:uncharacterized protein (TIGR02271 family)
MDSSMSSYDAWIGRDAYDPDGDKIGEVAGIYYDEHTGRPEWIVVRTGLFGTNVSFAPIAGSSAYGDDLQLAYDKDKVKDAPNVDPDGYLEADEERRLFEHYEFEWSDDAGYGDTVRADRDFSIRDDAGDAGTDVAETTRSEEQLRVGTETVPTGKARLRKYVVTEQQTVTVPVTREEVRVEREPVSGREVAGDLGEDIGDIGDAEAEVTTYAERPVVSTERVAKEKVRLVKDTVSEDETVSGEVRKERVDVDVDDDVPTRR